MNDKRVEFVNNNYNDSNGNNYIFIDKKKKLDVIKDLLCDRRFLMMMSVLILVFTCVMAGKTFWLRSKVNTYEEQYFIIEQKESTTAIAYKNEVIDHESLKKVAAEELIACINSPIDVNNLPVSVTSVIKEINNYYYQSNDYFAFKYKDLYTGFSVEYNENQSIFTASTIKAPTDIYVYEMASAGKINLDEKVTYTSNYYDNGAWELKNKNFNTQYTVRQLLNYSTVQSDNAAHNMLMDKFGRGNMYGFWTKKGTKHIFVAENNWGITSAHDATIYMEELYKFYITDEKYSDELMANFLNSTPKFLKGDIGVKSASKSGWAGSAVHDIAIMFDDNPYIVIALSNLGTTGYYTEYFNRASDFALRLHKNYWDYKMETCNKIDQS